MPVIHCVICGRGMEVSEDQLILMRKIGAVTCGPVCATKWVIAGQDKK